MTLLLILIGVPLFAGVAIAIFEWRKGLRMNRVATLPQPHDRDRAAFTQAERIRSMSNPTQLPHGSDMF